MTNPAYAKGANRERQLAQRLKDDGWRVVRSAGSQGVCDLVAGRRGKTLMLEVKTTQTPFQTFGPEKRREMREAAGASGWSAALVWWPPNRPARWYFESEWPDSE